MVASITHQAKRGVVIQEHAALPGSMRTREVLADQASGRALTSPAAVGGLTRNMQTVKHLALRHHSAFHPAPPLLAVRQLLSQHIDKTVVSLPGLRGS